MADLPKLPADNALTVQDEGKDAVFASILETLQSNNFLLDEIEDNTESDESATEKRNRRITDENTDPKEKGPGLFSNIGSGLKATGGVLQKLNPFQDGVGSKKGMLMLAGILYAISRFGDKLIKPLASVLEMIDKEGGLIDKFKDTAFFKNAIVAFDKFKERAKLIGDDVAKLLEAATTVGSLIKSAYESIFSYISSFDTTGAGPAGQYADGKLDALEMQNLKDDLMKKAQDLVTSIIGTVWNEISFATKLMFAAGGAVSVLLQASLVARIAKMIAGVDADGDKKDGDKKNKDNKPSDKKDNFKSKSKMAKVLSRTASAFTIGSSATTSTVANTARVASLAPGTGINSAGRTYALKTGRFVAQYQGATFGLKHLAKYPGLINILRKAPFLLPFIAGAEAISIFNDPNNTHEDKIEGLGGVLGGLGGSVLLAQIGAALGTMALPGWGTAIGTILGAGGGYFAGEQVGKMLAGFMMGEKPEMPFNFGESNLGSTLNTSTGTVENLPIQTMSGTSGYETNAGVNDQYYDGEVPKMSITSSGEYPQESVVSQLDGSLMNRNSDLAIAAYQADKNTKLLQEGYTTMSREYNSHMRQPAVVPIINSDSHDSSFSTFVGSSLTPDNNSTGARLLSSGAYSTLGLDFLKSQ